MSDLTAEILRELLDYNPKTGEFRWKHRHNKNKKWNDNWEGKLAGSSHVCGYRQVCVNRTIYLTHRLAWLYVYGEWPKNHIDHVNRIKTDNRISNLREATRAENNRNVGLSKNNTSGFKGVSWYKALKCWRAYISQKTKQIHIGFYNCPIEAAKAYNRKAVELHGEYAKINDLSGVT